MEMRTQWPMDRRKWPMILAMLIIGVFASGCISFALDYPAAKEIHVRVVDDKTDAPVVGALVFVTYPHTQLRGEYLIISNAPRDAWATTDAKGEAVLRGNSAGEWSFGAEGYIPTSRFPHRLKTTPDKVTVRLRRIADQRSPQEPSTMPDVSASGGR